jgi:glycosyltransferase involved in cell wall biosynthesis
LFQCYKNADALLMQTSYSTSLFQEWFPSSWPVEIGAGVDQAELTNGRISGERFRLKHGLTSRHIVLFVGRKESGKRYDLALAAVEALNDPNTILVMIGADVDGKRLPSSSVLYLGSLPRDELLDAYDACDVFVMPSESESFGLVFLEAWMRRKPVIGNANCGPVAALINDEDDGFLCETIEEIITRLRQLFQNPVRAEQMGNTGYTKVIQRYTWAIVGQKAYQLYSQIAERRLTSA